MNFCKILMKLSKIMYVQRFLHCDTERTAPVSAAPRRVHYTRAFGWLRDSFSRPVERRWREWRKASKTTNTLNHLPPPSDRAKPRGMRCQCALQRAPPGCVRVSLCACAPPGGSAYAGVANQEWLSKGEIESKWVGVVAVFRLKPSRAILTKHV